MLGAGLVVYVRIRPHWVSVRVLPHRGGATQTEGMARVVMGRTINGAEGVIAFGDEASTLAAGQDVTIHEAFCHPRVLIGGVDKAQLVVGRVSAAGLRRQKASASVPNGHSPAG